MGAKLPDQNRSLFIVVFSFGLIGLFLSVVRLDLLWSLISSSYTGLIYGISRIKQEDRIQRDIFKWTPIPLFFGVTGLSPFFGRIWIFGDLAFAAMAPILGFMIILNLTYHTDFETNLYFSVSFIFLFTLAAGAILVTGQFTSDRFLNTDILVRNDQLMIELLVITISGIIGAYAFRWYRKIYYLKWESFSILNRIRTRFENRSENPRRDLVKTIYAIFGKRDDDFLLLTSKILQIGIIGLVVSSAFLLNKWAFTVGILSFALSMIPYIFSTKLKRKIPVSFQFWISSSLFFYLAGETVRFQIKFRWWNNITHFLAGIVVGLLILIYLIYIDHISQTLHIPPWMILFLVITFILSVSVLWELFEFSIDVLIGIGLQGDFKDTILDMIFNTIGTFFALLLTTLFTSYRVFKPLARKIDRVL